MFPSLGHYGARPQPWEERRWRQRRLELQLQGQELLGMEPCAVRRLKEEEEQDAVARRVLARSSSSSSSTMAYASLKQRQRRGQEEEEEEESYTIASYHHHYPSSFLSLSSSSFSRTISSPSATTSSPPPTILALSTTTSSAAGDAERKRKELMAQLERTLKRAQLVFGPKRPYMADMREPFHHFRAKDLLQCVLRAMLQASLIPVHRWLDEFLERIQEAERRAALLDALEEDDEAEGLAPEEEEELLRIEMPKLGVYFRNFEWRVLVNVARSLGTKTIHYTLLVPLLNMYLSPRAMDRLTKDPVLSARRKTDRLASSLLAAAKMPKTAAYGTVTLSLSNLLWDLLVLGYDLLVDAYPHWRIGPKGPLLPPPPPPPQHRQWRPPTPPLPRRRRRRVGVVGEGMLLASEEEEEEEEETVVFGGGGGGLGSLVRLTGGAVPLQSPEGEGGGDTEEVEMESEEEEEEEPLDEEARAMRRREQLRGRVRQILLVNSTAYAASVVFMSVGTLVYPGIGTTVGAILGDVTPLLLGL